jgi:hypothetical protein
MQTILIKPDSKDKLDALVNFLKAFKIKFEASENTTYNQDFVADINKAREDIKAGKGRKVSKIELENLWN